MYYRDNHPDGSRQNFYSKPSTFHLNSIKSRSCLRQPEEMRTVNDNGDERMVQRQNQSLTTFTNVTQISCCKKRQKKFFK